MPETTEPIRGSGEPAIFMSIGRPLNKEQLGFKRALISAVKVRGLKPELVGREPEDTRMPHDRPIEQVRRILRGCHGAIIVAYEKHSADRLKTNSLSEHPGELSDVRFTTSWNQAEAGMAYTAGLPLLLISEQGVFGECFLEDGVVGSIERIAIRSESVLDEVFQRQMASWVEAVNEHWSSSKRADRFHDLKSDELTLRQIADIFSNLSWKASLMLIGTLVAIVSGAFGLGHWVR